MATGSHPMDASLEMLAGQMRQEDRLRELALRTCSACGATPATNRCGRCGLTSYCDVECQKLHWASGHKRQCVAPSRPAPAAASAVATAHVPYADAQTLGYAPRPARAHGCTDASIAEHLAATAARYAFTAAERTAAAKVVAAVGTAETLPFGARHPVGAILEAVHSSSLDGARALAGLLCSGLRPKLTLSMPCPGHGGRIEHSSLLHMALFACDMLPARSGGGANGGGSSTLHTVTELLLRAGTHVDVGNVEEGQTPLAVACRARDVGAVRALLDAGADVRAATDGNGATPLHEVCCKKGEDRHRTGGSAAAAAAASAWTQRGHAIIQLLCTQPGVQLEATSGGFTPLLMAVDSHNIDFASALLTAGAHVNGCGGLGMTPLTFALRKHGGASAIAALLRSRGGGGEGAGAGAGVTVPVT